MKISIFGTGYVGLVSGACLAEIGHDVVCMDVDPTKISNLNIGVLTFGSPAWTRWWNATLRTADCALATTRRWP